MVACSPSSPRAEDQLTAAWPACHIVTDRMRDGSLDAFLRGTLGDCIAARLCTHSFKEGRTMRGKRFSFILASLLTLLALTLGACGAQGGGSSTGSGVNYSGTIVIWHNWQGSYLNEKRAIFDAYQHLHPNVTIQLIHQDDLIQKATNAVNAGQGPDMIAWVDDQLGALAKSQVVVPLDKYIDKSFVESTYNPAAAQAVQFNGHVYGVPESVEAITLMYNPSLVSADQLPKTTDDMVTFNQTFAQAHPGSYGIVWNPTDAYFNAPWFYGFGGYYVKEDGTVGLNTPGSLAAGKFIASFRPTLPKQIDYGVADTLFKEGKAAAIINGPWAYSDYAKLGVGFATLPNVTATGKPASPFVGVKSLWVTKTSKNAALDADLMKFYTNTANQIVMSKVNGEIPANLAADNDPSVQALPSVGGFAAQAKVGVPLPNTPYMSALWDPTAKALQTIWNGSQTPDKALSDAQTAAEAKVQTLK
jgi:arabinogalactan oligomer / maltooligosaccharide transport system substrate-binding protein